jgi:tetratricopeptide (TPR) repeat protein
MKKTILLVILYSTFYILHSFSFAQNKNIDSLLILIKTDKPDTSKVIHSNKLCSEYLNIGLYDTALYYGNAALVLANKLDFKKGISNTYNCLGNMHLFQSDYSKSIDYYLKALKIDEELKDKKGMAMRLANIGTVYRKQSDYPKALDYNFKALKLQEELKNKNGIASLLSNIGIIYVNQSDYPKALDHYFRSLKMAEELADKKVQASSLTNIGNVYSSQADYPKALEYFFKSLKIKEELGNKDGVAKTLTNIGIVHKKQKDFRKAIDYYFKALKISEELGDKNNIALLLANIGVIYTETRKFKEAEQYLKRSIAICDSVGAMDHLRLSEEALSQLYDTTGRHHLALFHYKKAILLKDTIFSQENKKQLIQKEMNYEFDKKEAATKAEHDKEMAVAEAEKKKQQFILILVSGFLLLVFLFAGFIFRSLRITRKQKKIIESQKFQIVESINYSKKIQNSLLPNLSDMQKNIAGLFVFYEPKDIVSGDFYYFKEFENYSLLACVDCTGHGVSGGFMSTLSSLLLDKIVNSELLSPSQILSKLSNEIIRVLHQQDGGEIQDGMDLSICLIDRTNKKIEFSGARNGIIVVTNEQARRYKADPLPVGGNYMKKGIEIERNFTTQSISINSTDWIYMYTDGFMEQVGGKEGIPMNYTQFENQLINVSKKQNRSEKNIFLQMELDIWRGTYERDDDVLIIGFQVS